ncbi:MAG: hypothetical protein RQ741_06315, partial [Wenzhouxiangellaceae bacterium]|nr:hypothetical protein [Wenzhouxiangellaceae bacterium]
MLIDGFGTSGLADSLSRFRWPGALITETIEKVSCGNRLLARFVSLFEEAGQQLLQFREHAAQAVIGIHEIEPGAAAGSKLDAVVPWDHIIAPAMHDLDIAGFRRLGF